MVKDGGSLRNSGGAGGAEGELGFVIDKRGGAVEKFGEPPQGSARSYLIGGALAWYGSRQVTGMHSALFGKRDRHRYQHNTGMVTDHIMTEDI